MKEVNSCHNSVCILTRNVYLSSTLTAYCYVKCFVSIFTKLVECNVFSYFNTCLKFNTHLTENIDFCCNNILFKYEGRNTVNNHTSKLLIFLENCRFIAFFRKIECTWNTGRTSTYDSDLLFKLSIKRRYNFLWYKSCLCFKILHCDKFLYLIDCYSLIDSRTCTCILASSVTYMSTDRRKRIIFLYKFKSICISALCRKLKITLDCNMRRTCCFTWCCSRLMCLDTVFIPVIFCPHFRSPLLLWRKRHLRILYLWAIFFAKLLSKCGSSRRAYLHTATAGNTLFCFNMRYICWTWHVRCIKKLWCTECITYVYIAVTYGKNLIFSVYICNLVNKTIILCFFKYL